MISKRYRALTVCAMVAVLAMTVTVPGYAADKMTLADVVAAAMDNNPAVMEMEKRAEEKARRVTLAKAWPNPRVGIMKDDIPDTTWGPGQGMMTEYSFSQEIMYPGKLSAMGKMAAGDALMAQENYREKKLQLYVDAKQSYYDLLYASRALQVGKEIQLLMGQLAQLAQINYSTGMVPLQDTLRAQTEFSKMTTDLLNMAAMEAVASAKLNTVMGRPADAALAVSEEFNAPPPNFDLAALQNDAAALKPALKGMNAQVDMAQSGVALAKLQSAPDFELRLGYKDPKDKEMAHATWKAELMMMLPVWQGKNKAEIDAATASLGASKAALQTMKNMVGLDVQMALVEAQTAWRRIDLYKTTILPQAEQSYQASVIAYTNGKADFMAVLDGLATLRNAKLDHYKAQVDYEKAAANLEKAVGKPLFGSVGDL